MAKTLAVVTTGVASAHRTLAAPCTRHEGRITKLVRFDFDLHCTGVGARRVLIIWVTYCVQLCLLLLRSWRCRIARSEPQSRDFKQDHPSTMGTERYTAYTDYMVEGLLVGRFECVFFAWN